MFEFPPKMTIFFFVLENEIELDLVGLGWGMVIDWRAVRKKIKL
jgi:hypothetical protein